MREVLIGRSPWEVEEEDRPLGVCRTVYNILSDDDGYSPSSEIKG
jgi:hypothetical protein